jgi:predicted PurR-regulated permease PerM
MAGNSRLLRIALTLAIIALLIFITERLWTFGYLIGGIVSTMAAAWFIAFIVKPPINYLKSGIVPVSIVEYVRKRYGSVAASRLKLIRLPMGLAIAMVYAVVLVLIIGLATVITATIIPQAADLIRRVPEFAAEFPNLISSAWADFAVRFGLDPNAINTILASQNFTASATQAAGIAAAQVLNLAAVTAGLVGQAFLVLILSLYIVVEDKLLKRQLFMVLPRRMHETASALLDATDRAFSGYLRGQVVAAFLRGVFTFGVFALFGVNFGLLVSIGFALLSFIPLIGGPVGIAIAAIVVLIVRPEATLPVVLLVFAFDQLVAYGVLPRLMRDTVGVPSLIALLTISVGVQLLGFWGLIFGVPIVGVIYTVLFEFYLPRRRRAEGLPDLDVARNEPVASVTANPQPRPLDLPREEQKSPSLKGTR